MHIANKPAASSPWGLADIQNIITLNREYNEKATEISDIINYHTEPVTVITGAKSSSLERGANKIWASYSPTPRSTTWRRARRACHRPWSSWR